MVAVLAARAVGSAEVVAAVDALRDVLSQFDAALVSGADAASVAEALIGCERSVTAARLSAAFRAADCGAYPRGAGPDGGRGDAADWLARSSGGTRRRAIDELRLADRLDRMPLTRTALADGIISSTQAAEIAMTEADAPGSEADMLALAQRADLATLREEGCRRRQRELTPEQLATRQRKARYHRTWLNDLGMECGSYAVLPGEGKPFHSRLDAETDRRVHAEKVAANRAAKEGRLHERQTRDQHAADAFLAMTRGEGKGKAGRADIVVTVDLHTLLGAKDGAAQLLGNGPIPIDQVRELLLSGSAFLKVLLHDGVDVLAVKHHGRKLPAELRTALTLGTPPTFPGPVCGIDGCGRRHGLQLDHKQPVAAGGTTSIDNLWWLCWLHHQAKTDTDRANGSLTPGKPHVHDAERGPP